MVHVGMPTARCLQRNLRILVRLNYSGLLSGEVVKAILILDAGRTYIMKLRIKFKKYGPVRFIGHLDVMRFFQKAIRRAGIDVTYTTGFSPHQVMSFASPLGVGLASNGEYMDIQVNSLPVPRDGLSSCQVLVEQLNTASVKGLDIVSARVLPETVGNAMASVAAASYTVRFQEGRKPLLVSGGLGKEQNSSFAAEAVQAAIDSFLDKNEILITKGTKRGTREVNLRPGIYELAWSEDAFHMLVDASSAGNIKPVQVITALLADCGERLQENALLITREDVFTETMDQSNGRKCFVSLGEIGCDGSDVNSGGVR